MKVTIEYIKDRDGNYLKDLNGNNVDLTFKTNASDAIKMIFWGIEYEIPKWELKGAFKALFEE